MVAERDMISRARRVLVVGPDAGVRAALIDRLRSGAATGELLFGGAATVAEAQAEFRAHHPDLLLIDTAEFAGLGRPVARLVREGEGQRHTGIIFFGASSKLGESLAVECLEMGADDFLRAEISTAELLARVRAVLRLKEMTDELRRANHQLSLLSLTDELTGLYNMRGFRQRLAEAMRRCQSGRAAVGAIMLDLDRFKEVNDRTNHLVGSHVLRETGRLIRQVGVVRADDVAARYGGDEFIVLCEASSLAEVVRRAEEIRQAIGRAVFERDGQLVQVTASLGAAWVPRGFPGTAEDLVRTADLMLYHSKKTGRDRVSAMTSEPPAAGERGQQPWLQEMIV